MSFISLFMLSATLVLSAAEAEAQEQVDHSHSDISKSTADSVYALIVGISEYEHLSTTLKYTTTDADSFSKFLQRKAGVPKENIRLLLGKDARLDTIRQSLLYWLPEKTKGKNSKVFVMFALHGIIHEADLEPEKQEMHFLVYDTKPTSIPLTALSANIVKFAFDKLSTNKTYIYFFADVCHSGQRETAYQTSSISWLPYVSGNKRLIFSSSKYRESSLELDAPFNAGLFTYYLKKGLGGDADANADSEVSLKELVEYTQHNVRQTALQYGFQQTPVAITNINENASILGTSRHAEKLVPLQSSLQDDWVIITRQDIFPEDFHYINLEKENKYSNNTGRVDSSFVRKIEILQKSKKTATNEKQSNQRIDKLKYIYRLLKQEYPNITNTITIIDEKGRIMHLSM